MHLQFIQEFIASFIDEASLVIYEECKWHKNTKGRLAVCAMSHAVHVLCGPYQVL